mgnify:CR=1 FL=1
MDREMTGIHGTSGEGRPKKRVGIIICARYHNCGGGKCLRALKAREGAFSRYRDQEVELVGYTTCDGCPGGNVEYAPAEMKKNGADVVHLCSSLLQHGPEHLKTVLDGLTAWMEAQGFEDIDLVRGRVSQMAVVDPAEFERANYINVLDSHSHRPGAWA